MTNTLHLEVTNLSYSNFVSILLTIVTVLLGVLAVIVALSAFYTFRRIRLDVKNLIESEAKKQIETLTQQSKISLTKDIKDEIDNDFESTLILRFNKFLTDENIQNKLKPIIRNIVKEEIISLSLKERKLD